MIYLRPLSSLCKFACAGNLLSCIRCLAIVWVTSTAFLASQSMVLAEKRSNERDRFGVSIELLGALPVDSENEGRFGGGLGGAVHAEYDINDVIGLHVGVLGLTFGSADGSSVGLGTEWLDLHAGGRVHWGVMADMSNDDGWIDVHANIGTSGGIKRAGMDLGVGYEFNVKKKIRYGPVLRFQFGLDPLGNHAQIITVGLTATVMGSDRFKKDSSKRSRWDQGFEDEDEDEKFIYKDDGLSDKEEGTTTNKREGFDDEDEDSDEDSDEGFDDEDEDSDEGFDDEDEDSDEGFDDEDEG